LIFVDSSVWVDFFNGRFTPATERLDELLGHEPLLTGDIVLAEVLQGFREDRDFQTARRLLTSLDVVTVLNPELAISSAQNFRRLRKSGVTVRKTIDAIIATFCIEYGLWLLHSDRDFTPFETHLGLKSVPLRSG